MQIRPIVFALASLGFLSPLCAADAPKKDTPAKDTAEKKSDDLSQYKTADDLWKHLGELKRGPGHGFKNKEEMVGYLDNIKASSVEFIRRYPDDARRWEAKMMNAQVTAVLAQVSGGKATGDQQEAVCKEIIAAPDAPAPVKVEARFGLLQIHLVPAMQKEELTPDLENEIAGFEKDFPDDPRTASLELMRVQFLEKKDPAKAEALLNELAKSKNARVAEEAKGRLKQKEVTKKPFDLKFTAVDGTEIDLTKMRGKVVLIDFWATWCGPCMGEVPHVVETYKKHHNDGFEIVGISLDQDKEKLLSVTKEKGMVWPQYFDGKGWQNAISSSYGIESIPAMWLVNKKGYVVSTDARDGLESQVAKLLAE